MLPYGEPGIRQDHAGALSNTVSAMSYMLKEIKQQPEAVARTLSGLRATATRIAADLRARPPRFVIFAARGSSAHAGIYGRYLFECRNGIPTAPAALSVFTRYRSRLRLDGSLLIGISQSGRSPDVVEVVRRAAHLGAITCAVTNDPASDLARAAHFTLCCRAGRERSVAATKTFAAELAALALLSAAMSGRAQAMAALDALPGAIEKALTVEGVIAEHAERYRYAEGCVVLGRGYNYATARETALKLQETCYLAANAFSNAAFMHGPIAMVGPHEPVILFAPHGRLYGEQKRLVATIRRDGAETVVVSDREEILRGATTPVRVPVQVDEPYSPFTHIVAGQLFAHYLALARGLDPDHPRRLHKVTRTL